MAGRPDVLERAPAPPRDCVQAWTRGVARPIRSIASRKSWRSSALSMASALAPIISTPKFARTPCLCRASAVLSAVWPPMVGSSASGPLLLDDLGDDLGRDGLDIGCIGQLRIGHDRGRVGVDQNDAIALGLERLAGLGAGIVELAGLTDDDGTRADDEDGLDICALRHGRASYCTATGMAIAGRPNPRSAHPRNGSHWRVTRQPFFWAPWRKDSQGSERSARGVRITKSTAGRPLGSRGT